MCHPDTAAHVTMSPPGMVVTGMMSRGRGRRQFGLPGSWIGAGLENGAGDGVVVRACARHKGVTQARTQNRPRRRGPRGVRNTPTRAILLILTRLGPASTITSPLGQLSCTNFWCVFLSNDVMSEKLHDVRGSRSERAIVWSIEVCTSARRPYSEQARFKVEEI